MSKDQFVKLAIFLIDHFKYLKLGMYDCKIENYIGFSIYNYMGWPSLMLVGIRVNVITFLQVVKTIIF